MLTSAQANNKDSRAINNGIMTPIQFIKLRLDRTAVEVNRGSSLLYDRPANILTVKLFVSYSSVPFVPIVTSIGAKHSTTKRNINTLYLNEKAGYPRHLVLPFQFYLNYHKSYMYLY